MSRPVLAPRPRRWLDRNILGLGLASLFSDWNHEMASAVLPAFVTGVLGAPAFALGLIEGVAGGVSMAFQLASGWTSDRVGRRKGLALLGYALTAFSKAAFALTVSWQQVLALRTSGWVGRAIRSPVRDALFAESTTRASIGRAFAFHRTLDTLGAVLGPLTAALLVAHLPVRAIFLLSLLPGLGAVVVLAWLVRERPRAPDRRAPWHSLRALPRDFRRFLLPVGLFGVANFAPTLLILRAQELLGTMHAGTAGSAVAVGLYAFSNVVYALVAYPIAALTDRCDKRHVLATGFALFGLVYAGFAAARAGVGPLVALFAMTGLATAIVEAVQPTLASLLMHEDQHGTGFGVLNAVDGCGDFVSSTAMGLAWTFVSPIVGFAAAAALALLSALVLAAMRLSPPGQAGAAAAPNTCA